MKYLLSFVEEGTEVKERPKKEKGFCKFVNFLQDIFYMFICLFGELSLD